MLKFILGAFVGGIISFIVFALCSISKIEDQSTPQINEKTEEKK